MGGYKQYLNHRVFLDPLMVLVFMILEPNQVGKTLEVKKDFDLPAYATLVLIAA